MTTTKRCLYCNKPIEEGYWHEECIRSFFGVNRLPEISLDKSNLEKHAIEQIEQRKAVAGVQEKLSLHLDLTQKKRPRLTIMDYPSGYILKPQSSRFKQLPEFEHTAMLLADLCLFKTVPHALIPINGGEELAFITKRIDREGEKKIHMEDFCQASGSLTENKYRASYEECMGLIQSFSANPEFDRVVLFSYLYFSFIIGNSDLHLKNFSFIMDEEGKLRLSPFYDVLPTKVILPSDHDDLGMVFNGRKSNLHGHDFSAFAAKVGISEASKQKMMKAIEKKAKEMKQIIADSLLNQNAKSVWMRMIDSNINRANKP